MRRGNIGGAFGRILTAIGAIVALLAIGACSSLPPAEEFAKADETEDSPYLIGPNDSLQIFVWRNPELSVNVTVRPDGRISTPLVEDMKANNKTPSALARDIEEALAEYVQDPIVSVMVSGFTGPFSQRVRVVGEASEPLAIPYSDDMTLLDVMIAVGGMTEFADGNDAVVVRDGRSLRVRLDDLLKDGDVSANVQMAPGDILIIPESWF